MLARAGHCIQTERSQRPVVACSVEIAFKQ